MTQAAVPVRFGRLTATVQAVAFDKDGTLLQTRPFWYALYQKRRALIAQAAGEELAASWEKAVGAPSGSFDRRGPFAIAPQGEMDTLLAGLFYRYCGWSWEECRETSRTLNQEANESLPIAEICAPRPGVVDMVRALKEAGVAVGVLTSDNERRARQGLDRVGLPPETWSFVLTPDLVAHPKPAPDMILAACAQVGCTPAEMAMVGDSIVDMQMARQAGSLAVAVPEEPEDGSFLLPLSDVMLQGPHQIRVPVRPSGIPGGAAI